MGVTDDTQSVPQYADLLWPVIRALRDLGGSGAIDEIAERVSALEGFPDEVQSRPHGRGGRSEVEYRLAWARTYLKGMGLATNSARGVWSLTDTGRRVDEGETRRIHAAYVAQRQVLRRQQRRVGSQSLPEAGVPPTEAESWQDSLLEMVIGLRADQFERLSQRLLREAGFINTTVVGRSGDGGIDGMGVYRLSLVSFPVFFQCKKYRGSVGPGAVRDFRGAMAGRGDKGLLITTGSFTSDAKQEATRPGATPIDLIDGTRLAELLKQYELGITTRVRSVEDVQVDAGFFREL